jgi:hypothetical protein
MTASGDCPYRDGRSKTNSNPVLKCWATFFLPPPGRFELRNTFSHYPENAERRHGQQRRTEQIAFEAPGGNWFAVPNQRAPELWFTNH